MARFGTFSTWHFASSKHAVAVNTPSFMYPSNLVELKTTREKLEREGKNGMAWHGRQAHGWWLCVVW